MNKEYKLLPLEQALECLSNEEAVYVTDGEGYKVFDTSGVADDWAEIAKELLDTDFFEECDTEDEGNEGKTSEESKDDDEKNKE